MSSTCNFVKNSLPTNFAGYQVLKVTFRWNRYISFILFSLCQREVIYFLPNNVLKLDSFYFISQELTAHFHFSPSNNTNHHVTLVVTKAGSYSDYFCRQHLIPLDKTNNPFLYYNHWKKSCFTNVALNVEIFYTENINIGYLMCN